MVATSFMYEGAPTYPYPNRWWQMIEKYGINILYTAPTAIRGLMRFGDAWPNRHDLSSLTILGSVGEPINPEAWRWYHKSNWKRKMSDYGYLVANRNRNVYDNSNAMYSIKTWFRNKTISRN